MGKGGPPSGWTVALAYDEIGEASLLVQFPASKVKKHLTRNTKKGEETEGLGVPKHLMGVHLDPLFYEAASLLE